MSNTFVPKGGCNLGEKKIVQNDNPNVLVHLRNLSEAKAQQHFPGEIGIGPVPKNDGIVGPSNEQRVKAQTY